MKRKTQKKTIEAPIFIGATKESIEAVLSAVTTILDYDRDPTVLVEALRTFREATSVNGTTIRDCTFTTKS